MEAHLESRFHKDHFKFLSSQLSKPTTDFLQVTEISRTSHLKVLFTIDSVLCYCKSRNGRNFVVMETGSFNPTF